MISNAALTDDERFLLIYNFNPAQSLAVIDTKTRKFVREIETPGCALVYPTGPRSFFSVCGDGSLLLVSLNDAAVATLNTPAVETRLREIGVEQVAPERRSPEYLAKFVQSEIEKWAGPIKAAGISTD